MDVRFVELAMDSFCVNRVFSMNIQFCCHLYCSSFATLTQSNDDLFLSLLIFTHCTALFLFTDVIPLFVYANITTDPVTLNIPNNEAVFHRYSS
jgi:hypothetical protein